MTNSLALTQTGKEKLEKELDELKNVVRPKIIKKIEYAKDLGDLSENAEYHEAKDEQGLVESRIREIEEVLKTAEIVSTTGNGGSVEIGSNITIEMNGEEKKYTIVGFNEQNPAEGKISNESPLGQAFIGHKKGDTVEIHVPKGVINAKIIDVK